MVATRAPLSRSTSSVDIYGVWDVCVVGVCNTYDGWFDSGLDDILVYAASIELKQGSRIKKLMWSY